MPLTIKQNGFKFKDSNDDYVGVDVIAETTLTEQIAAVEGEGATQVAAVQAKGTQVINSIPSDYTELTEEVDSLKSAITDAAIIQSSGWVNKGINDGTGAVGSANSKRLTQEDRFFNKYMKVSISSAYKIIAYGYSEDLVSAYLGAWQNNGFTKSGISWQSGSIDLMAMRDAGAKYMRVLLKKADDTDISPSDGENAKFDIDNVFFTEYGLSEVQSTFTANRTYYDYPLQKYDELVPTVVNSYGWNFEKSVNGLPSVKLNDANNAFNAYFTFGSSLNVVGVGRLRVLLYVEDPTIVSGITVYLTGTSWYREISETLVKGWNVCSLYTAQGSLSTWETATGLRLYISRTANTSNIYYGGLFANRPPKANMIFVEDGQAPSFYTDGYPLLKAAGIPVTWALVPKRIIDENPAAITAEQLETLAQDNMSEFSFHSWNLTVESSATEQVVRDEATKALHFLKDKGLLPTYFWRAATIQNASPYDKTLGNMVYAIATGFNNMSVDYFPFIDPLNVGRVILHSSSAEALAEYFETMRKTHCTMVIYTHGVSNETNDVTPELLAAFIEIAENAIEGGYVNPTTFNRLMMEYYNPIRQIL